MRERCWVPRAENNLSVVFRCQSTYFSEVTDRLAWLSAVPFSGTECGKQAGSRHPDPSWNQQSRTTELLK